MGAKLTINLPRSCSKFGFRYWKDPGVFANPYPAHGKLTSQFEGFLAAVRLSPLLDIGGLCLLT